MPPFRPTRAMVRAARRRDDQLHPALRTPAADDSPPGSDARVLVMHDRRLRGQTLWARGDRRDWGGQLGSDTFTSAAELVKGGGSHDLFKRLFPPRAVAGRSGGLLALADGEADDVNDPEIAA